MNTGLIVLKQAHGLNTLINAGKKVFKKRYLSHVRGKQLQLQTQFFNENYRDTLLCYGFVIAILHHAIAV